MKNKEKKKKGGYKLLFQSIRGNGGFLAIGLTAAAISVFTQFIRPIIISFAIDYVLVGSIKSFSDRIVALFTKVGDRQFYLDNIWILALMIIGITIINGMFYFVRNYFVAKGSEGVARTLRDRLYTHIQNLPYDYHKHATTGDLIQRCTSDVETVRRFVGSQLLELVRCAGFVILSVVLMFSFNSKIARVCIVIPPILLLFSFFYFKKVIEKFKDSDEAEGRLSAMLNENVSGVRVVRAFGQQRSEQNKFEHCNSDYRDVTYKLNKLLGRYWGFSDFLGSLQTLIVMVYATYLAATGEISLGTVMIFLNYANMLVWPIRQLGRILSDMGKAKVSLGRLTEITEAKEEAEPGKALTPEIKGEIEFKNVMFGYDYKDEVLKGISFKVKKGQTVSILGSTGSGKSSLIHLISRLYLATDGEILIDGVNINDIERHHLRHAIGTVMQEPFLYSRSIIENLKMANPNVKEDEIYDATRTAAIHTTISGFKEGYNTMVGERGVTLSGGEKQRVSIARMLLQKTPIIIFDDSLSAVDTETDTMIREALGKRQSDATTFIISHRITTLCEADFIMVLEDGKITDIGTHEELIAREGLYKRIADIQSFTQSIERKEA